MSRIPPSNDLTGAIPGSVEAEWFQVELGGFGSWVRDLFFFLNLVGELQWEKTFGSGPVVDHHEGFDPGSE